MWQPWNYCSNKYPYRMGITANDCTMHCGTTTPNTVCTTCLGKLRTLLETLSTEVQRRHHGPDHVIPGLSASLHVAATKQTRFSTGSARVQHSRGQTQPLPINLKATDARHALRNSLARWAGFIAEARNTTPTGHTIPALGQWLITQLDWLAAQPATPDLIHDLTQEISKATRVVDRPADRAYGGKCDTLDCPGAMYAYDGELVATCTDCRAKTDLETARRAMLERVNDTLLPAPDLEQALLGLGLEVKAGTIRKWCERGRLMNRGTNARPKFKVGDVRDLAQRQPLPQRALSR